MFYTSTAKKDNLAFHLNLFFKNEPLWTLTNSDPNKLRPSKNKFKWFRRTVPICRNFQNVLQTVKKENLAFHLNLFSKNEPLRTLTNSDHNKLKPSKNKFKWFRRFHSANLQEFSKCFTLPLPKKIIWLFI